LAFPIALYIGFLLLAWVCWLIFVWRFGATKLRDWLKAAVAVAIVGVWGTFILVDFVAFSSAFYRGAFFVGITGVAAFLFIWYFCPESDRLAEPVKPPRITGDDIVLFSELLDMLAKNNTPQTQDEVIGDIDSMSKRRPPRLRRRGMRRAICRALDHFEREWENLTLQQKEKLLFVFRGIIEKDKKIFKCAKERFLKIAEASYKISELEKEPVRFSGLGTNALHLSQDFHGHEVGYEIQLADDAIRNWGPGKFRLLWSAIELRSKDRQAFRRMRMHFEQMRADFAKSGDADKAGNALAFYGNIGKPPTTRIRLIWYRLVWQSPS
jgi:hypothetical protein